MAKSIIKNIKKVSIFICSLLLFFNNTDSMYCYVKNRYVPHGVASMKDNLLGNKSNKMNISNVSSMNISQVASSDSMNWMSKLSDKAKLCKMNIPGTHDSGTSGVDPITGLMAQCQDWDIATQLAEGIRYFDIRINGNGEINHGSIPVWMEKTKTVTQPYLGLTGDWWQTGKYGMIMYKDTTTQYVDKMNFGDVLDIVQKFLREHPKETVFLQLKSEGSGDCTNYVNWKTAGSAYLYRGNKNINELTLGDVRGKFILISRAEGVNYSYYTSFPNNTMYSDITIGEGGKGKLQDNYETGNNKELKWNAIKFFYNKAWSEDDDSLLINFISYSNVPRTNANLLSGTITNFLDNNYTKKLGIVIFDFPSVHNVQRVYTSNGARDLT